MCVPFVLFSRAKRAENDKMPRCFMPKKHLKNRPGMTERSNGGRRSPSPCVDLPPPPPPPPLLSPPPPPPPASHETNGDDADPETNASNAVSAKSGSNVYRPPTPVNHAGKCRSVGPSLFFLIDCRLTCQLSLRALLPQVPYTSLNSR